MWLTENTLATDDGVSWATSSSTACCPSRDTRTLSPRENLEDAISDYGDRQPKDHIQWQSRDTCRQAVDALRYSTDTGTSFIDAFTHWQYRPESEVTQEIARTFDGYYDCDLWPLKVRFKQKRTVIVMATLATIPGIYSLVRKLIVHDRKSHRHVSDELKRRYPTCRGLSPRSVRRFSETFNIHATFRISDSDLDASVRHCISRVSIKYTLF